MDTKIKVIGLENEVIIARIEQRFEKATRTDLFLIDKVRIYEPLKEYKYESKIHMNDIEDIVRCKGRRVFGIKENEEAIYAIFLMPYTYSVRVGYDSYSYMTKLVDSIGVLDTNLNLVAWTRYFSWSKENASKLYSDVAEVYNARKIKRDPTKKTASEKMRRERLNSSKKFIKKIEERLTE